MFSKKHWSPYFSGLVIGLLQIPALVFVHTALGTSSAYVRLTAHINHAFHLSVKQLPYLEKYATDDKILWQLSLVIGMILGGFISAKLSKQKRPAVSRVWQEMGLKSKISRFLLAFIGGMILLLGARLAGGCTSGHGLSGSAQFAISSWVTVCFMFLGGIIAAKFLFRGSK